MKALSEQLSELSERVKKVEDVVAAAREKNRARLETKRGELERSVAAGKAEVAQQVTAAQAAGREGWNALRSSLDQRFAELRAAAEKHRAEHDIHKAERRADLLEEDAADAIDLALYVLDQAEYAIVAAVIARADADELARQG